MTAQQVVPVACPNCGAKFNAPVTNLINGQQTDSKIAFLQGRLNLIQCPQCKSVNPLTMPILYYDLEKELALAYVPSELNIAITQQEKIIGDLTNALMKQLQPEQKKFYLFNPKTFLTVESLVNAVLEADGITPEIRAIQEAKAKLLQEILQIENEDKLKEIVATRNAELDYAFFELLTNTMQAVYLQGNQQFFQVLVNLRTALARWSKDGRKMVREIDTKLGLVILEGPEDLLERLQNSNNEQYFWDLIQAGHGYLDYGFFQQLATKIDEATAAGDAEQATILKELRTKILNVKTEQEEAVQVSMQKSAELLKEIYRSGNPQETLAANIEQIDESFFVILSAHLEQAQQQKQEQAIQSLETIGYMAMKMLQEHQAKKLQPESPEATKATQATANSEILIAKK